MYVGLKMGQLSTLSTPSGIVTEGGIVDIILGIIKATLWLLILATLRPGRKTTIR